MDTLRRTHPHAVVQDRGAGMHVTNELVPSHLCTGAGTHLRTGSGERPLKPFQQFKLFLRFESISLLCTEPKQPRSIAALPRLKQARR